MCDILNNNNIDIETNKKIFGTKKLVQISNFIKNDIRLKLLKEIVDKEHIYKFNDNNNTLNEISYSLLEDANLKEHQYSAMAKQYNVIHGSDIVYFFPDLHYYYHNCIADTISKIVGIRVYPVNELNTINNSLIIYESENDSIKWHKDRSIFNDKRVFTVLIYLYNNSTQKLCYIHYDDKTHECVNMDENTCVILEQFELDHMTTPILKGEKKIAWSMTFVEDINQNNPKAYLMDKIKNFGFIGTNALNTGDYMYIILFVVLIGIIVYSLVV
jgi:hypothetical protein